MAACCSMMSCQCITSPKVTNLMYVFIIALAALASISLRYGGIDLNIGFNVGLYGPSVCVGNATACEHAAFAMSICNSENCAGYWAVYRITFAVAGFFLLLALGTACVCQTSTYLHRGFWFGKLVALVGILAGTLFAPNDLFAAFAWVARFVAPLFLLYQLLIFIDCGYSLNDSLIAKDERQDVFFGLENEGFKYHAVILVLATLLYAGAFTGIGLMYAHWELSCAFNPLAITTTLLFGLAYTAVSISKIAEHGSLLCSGMIFAYSTWLCYASVSAYPDTQCNPQQSESVAAGSTEHIAMLILSCAIAALSCAYFAYRMGSGAIGGNAMTGGPSRAPAMDESNGVEMSVARSNDQITVHVKDDNSSAGSNAGSIAVEPASFLGYHLRMFIIAMYSAMLLTDWGVAADTEVDSAARSYNVGIASAWLQMGTNWLCCLLYLWTLVAPKLLPDRDFG